MDSEYVVLISSKNTELSISSWTWAGWQVTGQGVRMHGQIAWHWDYGTDKVHLTQMTGQGGRMHGQIAW